MYCKKCGTNIADGSQFCPACGEKQVVETVDSHLLHLICRRCGANMKLNEDGKEMICPYCGSKVLRVDSDAVAAEKVKSSAYRDVEMAKLQHEIEKEENAVSKEAKEKYSKGKLAKWSIVFVFICLIAAVSSFKGGHALAGIIAIVQMALFASSWLMGMQILPEKKKSMHTAAAILGFVLIIPFVMSTGLAVSEKLEWPESGLAASLPKPKTKNGRVIFNDSNSFWADLNGCSLKDYEAYRASCIEKGFTVDAKEDGNSYKAFNEKGEELNLTYYDSMKEMRIEMDAAKVMSTFTWPSNDMAKKLPKPESTIGTVQWENENGFSVYVGDTTPAAFAEYVEKCRKAGFDVDYSKGDDYYYAKDAAGNNLSLNYEGNNTMFLSADKAKEEETTAAATEAETTVAETTEASAAETAPVKAAVSGIRPEFKEAMDSYEAFFDEYVEIMEAFKQNPSSMEVLAKYADYMGRYADMMAKLDEVGKEDMSKEESAYYIEVMARIEAKLLKAAQ